MAASACASGAERLEPGIDDLQAHAGVGTDGFVLGQETRPSRDLATQRVQHAEIGVGAGDQRLQAAKAFRPFQRVEIILQRQHGRRVDGLAFEDAFDHLAALGHAEDFRHRPGRRVGFQAAPRHAARGPACRARPRRPAPSARRRSTTSSFFHGNIHGERRRGGVADRQAFAVVGDPVAVRHAHAARWCRSTGTRCRVWDRPASRSRQFAIVAP